MAEARAALVGTLALVGDWVRFKMIPCDFTMAGCLQVSGPPGIGKTTTCRLVAELHGAYEAEKVTSTGLIQQQIWSGMAEGTLT